MIEPADNPQPPVEQPPPPAAGRVIPRALLVGTGAVASVPIVGGLSQDWCCTPLGHSLLVASLVWAIDRFLLPVALRGRRLTWRLQILPVLLILAGTAVFFARSAAQEFERLFGVPVPAGVHDLSLDCASRSPAGGGEEWILMRFTTDQDTMRQILGPQGFVIDTARMKRWSEEGEHEWTCLWREAFGSLATKGGQGWANVKPMSEPVLYEAVTPIDDIHRYTARLLLDRSSGRVYVLFSNDL